MLAFVDLEERVPKDHPIRTIKAVADEALEHLSSEFDRMYAKVVVLAYFSGLTHSEISQTLGTPLSTVKTRMRLAMKKLREALAPRILERPSTPCLPHCHPESSRRV